MNQEHGEKGHLNIYVKDQDSHITGYGKHARIVVGWCSDDQCFYAREDFVHDLPASTDEQRKKVIKKDFIGWVITRASRIVLCSSEPYQNRDAIEHVYRIVE